MMITLSRVYPDGRIARLVFDELKAAGLQENDIGIVAPSRDRNLRLAGLCAFVLPGIGAVAAAGWFANALAGAVAGGAGGIVGALIEAGVSQNDAAQFAEGVKRGGTLVTVRVMGQDRDYYEGIMAITQVPKAAGRPGIPVPLRGPDPFGVKRP